MSFLSFRRKNSAKKDRNYEQKTSTMVTNYHTETVQIYMSFKHEHQETNVKTSDTGDGQTNV